MPGKNAHKVTIWLSEPMARLLESYRNRGSDPVTLSETVEDLLRKCNELQGYQRAYQIDFGSDADRPDYNALEGAQPKTVMDDQPAADEPAGGTKRRRSRLGHAGD